MTGYFIHRPCLLSSDFVGNHIILVGERKAVFWQLWAFLQEHLFILFCQKYYLQCSYFLGCLSQCRAKLNILNTNSGKCTSKISLCFLKERFKLTLFEPCWIKLKYKDLDLLIFSLYSLCITRWFSLFGLKCETPGLDSKLSSGIILIR